MNKKRRSDVWILLNDEEFTILIKNSKNYSDAMRYFDTLSANSNFNTLKQRIKELNIDTSHFGNCYDEAVKYAKNKMQTLESVMTENSTYGRNHLKRRLLEEGLLKNECSICGLDEEWNGKHIVMILDHINGISNDNRLENLRMVCPNCNSQLDTFGSRNYKKIKKIKIQKCYMCGKDKKINKSNLCRECCDEKQRRVERPTKEVLLQDIKELGYSGCGRKYGVSDNAIRKWLK